MRSSRWHAHGNVYLVVEGDSGGVDLAGTDGAVEIERVDGDDVEVAIVTPTARVPRCRGTAPASPAWLMERTGAAVACVHVGPRVVDGAPRATVSTSRIWARSKSLRARRSPASS